MRRRLIFWGIGLALLVPLFRYLEGAILFPGQFNKETAPAPDDAEVAWLQTDDGRTEYWTLLGEGVSEEAPGPAVIYAHGNGERIDMWPAMMSPYREMGVTVVLVEFRGYGRSDGSPSEDAISADLLSLHAALSADARIDADRLVYHGRSLGGGAVGTLLTERPPRALVLESTFRSVPAIAWERMKVPGFLLRNRFDTEGALERYEGPLLVIHGDRDTLIPPHHGEALAAARRPASAPEATLHLGSGGHNDLLRGVRYWQGIEGLLRSAGVLAALGD